MDFFKLLSAVPVITMEINKAMQDRVLTVQEVISIVDNTLKATLGKGLNDVGLKITKTSEGKTKVEIVV